MTIWVFPGCLSPILPYLGKQGKFSAHDAALPYVVLVRGFAANSIRSGAFTTVFGCYVLPRGRLSCIDKRDRGII